MFRSRRRQRGVILFIALIVLVAMSLAGIALIRSVDTANVIAGNLAFRQGATVAGDWGLEQARAWLLTNATADPTRLYNNQPAVTNGNGYWASWTGNLDFTGSDPAVPDFNWATAISVGTDAAGNQVSWVIHRLCQTTGDPAAQNCIRSSSGGSSSGSKGGVTYGQLNLSQGTQIFYRVTARIVGPRNTVAYVQSIMN